MSRTAAAASTSLAALMLVACAGRPQLISADGMLGGCEQPRCVSTQSQDPDRYVEPIRYEGSREAARAALQRIVLAMPGSRLALQTEDYLHVEFGSGLLGQVDDLELLFPRRQPWVQVRAASRNAYVDFDDNRQRVEQIRARFEAVQP